MNRYLQFLLEELSATYGKPGDGGDLITISEIKSNQAQVDKGKKKPR